MMIAPQPATKPAAGVIATKPVIMPFIAPTIEGLRKKIMSIIIQVSIDVAVQIFVFKTAAPASGEAVYGSCSRGQQLQLLASKIARNTHASVKTIPANPQNARPHHDKWNVIRLGIFAI
jgi:hypothetical protein